MAVEFQIFGNGLISARVPRAWARHDHLKQAATTRYKTLAEMFEGRKFPTIQSRVLPHWKVSANA